ncbi:RWD domain-containing protein 1-like [Lytechinus variegatus]|uniref:RWD domain-containing protein 1-like n=1 Tax=Lytechinus variegatus TaxID=7654 RepID=UPI001BB1DA3D|nr:RWD domain-containing protein 1-like [Lytechinus variegatus]
MTDYKEEQVNEIEALESIYPDEFSVLETKPFHVFQVTVSAEEESGEDEEEEKGQLSVTLKFTYTPCYPEEAPIFEVILDDELAQDYEQQISELVQAQIEENIGMAMIFAIVSASQEFLNEKIDEIKATKDDRKRRIEEEKKRAEEEAANKLKGTLVTIESFLAWKERFDQEQKELKAKQSAASDSTAGKLTGKELFFQNANLDTSDMDLLDESDRVEVDESLFQDLDLDVDLDLDDDED